MTVRLYSAPAAPRRRLGKRGRRALAVLAALAPVSVLTAACDLGANKITEPFNDAPRSPAINEAPATVIAFPDGFSNLATKCVNGNRYTVAFHGDSPYASIDVEADDPSCR